MYSTVAKAVDSTRNPPRTLKTRMLANLPDPYMYGRPQIKGGHGYRKSDEVTYTSIEQSYRPLRDRQGRRLDSGART